MVVGRESFLNSFIATGEIFPPNFNVFGHDRVNCKKNSIGVFIAVKNCNTDCEIEWISMSVTSLTVTKVRRLRATGLQVYRLLAAGIQVAVCRPQVAGCRFTS